jgi:tetratricopeptide (TPR) repeat protein
MPRANLSLAERRHTASLVQAGQVEEALEGLTAVVDHLCGDYPTRSPAELSEDALWWVALIRGADIGKLPHEVRERLRVLDGWLTLLRSSVEYDQGHVRRAQDLRRSGLEIAALSGDRSMVAWGHEMGAWFGLTQGRHDDAIEEAAAAQAAAPLSPVFSQAAGLAARTWARRGDANRVDESLGIARDVLETLSETVDPDHQFSVDPGRFEFQLMDCERVLGRTALARVHAEHTIRLGTLDDGSERTPLRNAEARIAVATAHLRDGDLDNAMEIGLRALTSERQSLPSLAMVADELRRELQARCPGDPRANEFHEAAQKLRHRVDAAGLWSATSRPSA